MLDDYVLNCFMEQNRQHHRFLVCHLGGRGFYAEVTMVARAVIYAWVHQLQLVLDSSDFAYSASQGWTDYFLPFCSEYSEQMESRVAMRIQPRSGAGYTPDRLASTQAVRGFRSDRLQAGCLTITGFREIFKVVTASLFRLGGPARAAVEEHIAGLHLPEAYVAAHVRRGDKLDDEDVYYPAELYLEHLGILSANPRSAGGKSARGEQVDPDIDTLFVMSDDWQAILEVEELIESRDLRIRVATLCSPESRGFDCWKARRGEAFMTHETGETGAPADWSSYVFDQMTILLAETIVASRAREFVSTRRSNVGTVIGFLHPDPRACRLLTRGHLKSLEKATTPSD